MKHHYTASIKHHHTSTFYLFIALLIVFLISCLFLTSCAPKLEVESAKPAREFPEDSREDSKETNIEETTPEETPSDKETGEDESGIDKKSKYTIEIMEGSFYPQEKIIELNTEIKWVKKDKRTYKLACYLGNTRVTLSPILKGEDSFSYTFLKEGDYKCITNPYGLINIIKVVAKESEESEKPLLSPTGVIIFDNEIRDRGRANFAAIALIGVIVLLFFVCGIAYSKKRER